MSLQNSESPLLTMGHTGNLVACLLYRPQEESRRSSDAGSLRQEGCIRLLYLYQCLLRNSVQSTLVLENQDCS